jgi:hypothetical protein
MICRWSGWLVVSLTLFTMETVASYHPIASSLYGCRYGSSHERRFGCRFSHKRPPILNFKENEMEKPKLTQFVPMDVSDHGYWLNHLQDAGEINSSEPEKLQCILRFTKTFGNAAMVKQIKKIIDKHTR